MSDFVPRPLINSPAHFTRGADLDAVVERWIADGALRTCVACLDPEWVRDGATNYGSNEDLRPHLQRLGDHIIGLASVPPDAAGDPRHLVDRRRDEGFGGLKLINPRFPYDDERFHGVYERAQELGLPILFHTGLLGGHPGTPLHMRGHCEYMRPWHLDHVARRFPELRIIGAHLGHPHQHEALKLADSYANVYFDICGGSASKAWASEIKARMAPFAGADWDDPDENLALGWFGKLVFGTDSATIPAWRERADDLMDHFRIPAETRERFYLRNAAQIFAIELPE